MKIQSAEEHTIHFVTTDNPYEVTYIRISSVSWLQGTTAGYTAVHSPHQLEEEFQKHIKEPKKPKPALSDIIMEGWKNHERQMQNIHESIEDRLELDPKTGLMGPMTNPTIEHESEKPCPVCNDEICMARKSFERTISDTPETDAVIQKSRIPEETLEPIE